MEWPCGEKHFFEGSRGQEAQRHAEWPRGEKHFFEGSRDQEAQRHTEWPRGEKHFLEGSMGHHICSSVRKPKHNTS